MTYRGLMCQLIEVTWFIWKLFADQLITLLDRDQCSVSYFPYFGIGAQENWYTSMLWSIDSCQNKVSADQYHLTISRAQVSTHRGQVFIWSYPLIRYWFSNDRRLKFDFLKIRMKYVVFMCRTIKILISNWPRTRNFSQLLQAGKTVAFDFSPHVHELVTFYVQFLCSDWSKFDRWVHAENLCSILNLVYFDS